MFDMQAYVRMVLRLDAPDPNEDRTDEAPPTDENVGPEDPDE